MFARSYCKSMNREVAIEENAANSVASSVITISYVPDVAIV